MRLHYAGTCAACGGMVARGEEAWWDASRRLVTCLTCRGTTEETPAPVFDPGEPGSSAEAKYERLHAKREQVMDRRWGRLAGVAKLLSDDPQSTRAWAKGAEGERRVAAALERELGDRVVLLYDRRIPGRVTNIDILAVATSGVWIVDAKHYRGRVERRDKGGWFSTDLRLYAGGRDQSKMADGLEVQMLGVRQALGDPAIPIRPTICFTGAEWGLFPRPFDFRGVRVTWPGALANEIGRPGPLTRQRVEELALLLTRRLPAK